jgi:hypothetical protein
MLKNRCAGKTLFQPSGVDVMTTIFGDFCRFWEKIIGVFVNTNVMNKFSSALSKKTSFFSA